MDPHVREAAAAISGIADTYGTRQAVADPQPGGCRLPSVGDWVSGCTAGKRWSGRVVSAMPANGTVDIEADGAWLCVPAADITH